jgi:radical SAM enzyme (TIGR01210 family)
MNRQPTRDEIHINRQTIEALREPKITLDPHRPLSVIHEFEAAERTTKSGTLPPTAAVTSIFLTGAECLFRCTMCDLWKHTLDTPTPQGAIPAQIDIALQGNQSTAAINNQTLRWIKLYNSSNFFDLRCVPREDWDKIASRVSMFDRVIVENHPRLVDQKVHQFAEKLKGKLEVAMGLETVFEPSIKLLNKQMSLGDFQRAATELADMNVDLRVFILLQPPGMLPRLAIDGVIDSLQFAEQCGARHASIIATRGGNGVMEKLGASGKFIPPDASSLEDCFDRALNSQAAMVVTVDLWDFQKLNGLCDQCVHTRHQRLAEMNLTQSVLPPCNLDCGCIRG